MSKINMTAEMIRKMQADLKKSLDDVGMRYGYKLTFGNGKYDSEGNFTLKLVGNKDGAKSADAQRYEKYRLSMHLPPLGTEMRFDKKYAIVGMNITGTKIHGVCNGLTYLLSTVDVQGLWKRMQEKAEKSELMA